MDKYFNLCLRKKAAQAMTVMLAVMMLPACGKSAGDTAASGKRTDKAPEYVFTYAENQTSDYPTTQAARYFARLVNDKTEGRIEIRV